ncbi:hypothetical protein Scep_006197 [Stephania cephalantha]|uniref:CCT domain-containing protein n=1 Tax=Stephania cephalantha TaxID=152367 RepID=A0AAP0K8S0_9MAGN
MSSDLFILNEPFARHSSTSDNIINSTTDHLDMHFFTDHQITQADEQIFQAIFHDSNLQIQSHPSHVLDPILFSSSPPSQAFNNLSINPSIESSNYSVYDSLGVKTEDCNCFSCFRSYDSYINNNNTPLIPHNNHAFVSDKFMQRSFSTQSLDRKPRFFVQPCFDPAMQSQNFDCSPEEHHQVDQLIGSMRRVCSAGDIQSIVQSSTAAVTEDGGFKVRRYNAEERKQRINRYRSKRTQRNFNKTIKYACRKTLADSRHRVRGRFARNDETGEIPKVSDQFNRDDEDDEDIWVDGMCDEEEELGRRGLLSSSRPTQIQYYMSY